MAVVLGGVVSPPVLVAVLPFSGGAILGQHLLRYGAVAGLTWIEETISGHVVVPDQGVALQFPGVVNGLQGQVAMLVRIPSGG